MARRSLLRKEIRQLRRDLRAADLKSVDLRFLAIERNTDIATAELRGRLAVLNELRGDVVSRGEFSSEIKGLNVKIDVLTAAQSTSTGKGIGINQAIGYGLGAAGLIEVILRATGH